MTLEKSNIYTKRSICNQGLPSVGSNASAGTLDFLRNSQQVHKIDFIFELF